MLSNQTLSSFFVFYGTATLFLEIIYSLVTSAKREAILFPFGCSEVNSTWLITSELANQRARKTLFTCVVYTKGKYHVLILYSGTYMYTVFGYILDKILVLYRQKGLTTSKQSSLLIKVKDTVVRCVEVLIKHPLNYVCNV